MDKKNKDGIWGYIIAIAIVVFWIWALVSGGGSGYGCHEDKYGNEICREDPRN